ncbi:hypothetical protein BDC45DRAFT_562951 [Circinella umbellata]|nr:hypothetical protein BDC45DRAFT_562951 [Circinella umbellata]
MAWNKHYNNGSAALNHHDYDCAIQQMTMAIEAFHRNELVSILDVRAEAYSKKMDFKSALNDARDMIHHAPESPLGYLRAGDIYTVQCNYGEAIDIYDLGLLSTSVTSDSNITVVSEQVELIKKRKQEAEAKQYRRFDFMQVLPFDVISLILEELGNSNDGQGGIEMWVTCLDVCRRWREVIPRCISTRHLNIKSWGKDEKYDQRVAQLLGPYIHSIGFSNIMTSNATRSALNLMIDRCQNIRNLEFNLCQMTREDMWPVLRRIGHHLTDLRIKVAPASDLTVDPLMKLCPNLTSFTFQQIRRRFATRDQQEAASSNASTDTSLLSITYLSVDVSQNILPIESLLRRCPKLRYLIIPYRPERYGRQRIAPELVLDLCPDLEYFDFQASLAQDSYTPPSSITTSAVRKRKQLQETSSSVTNNNYNNNNTEKLRELYIANLDEHSGDIFMNTLERTQHTLERLHIGVGAGDEELMGGWTRFGGLSFSNLQSFRCSVACSTVLLVSMLRQCPQLKDLEFIDVPNINDLVFDAVPVHLQRLALSHCHGISEIGLGKFIRDSARQLHEIELTQCRAVGDGLMGFLAEASQSLHTIRLVDNPRVTQKGLLWLVQGLAQTPAVHLHTLVMKHMQDAVTASVLHGVRNLPNLKTVDISGSYSVTDVAVQMVVDQNPQLQHLIVNNCIMITQLALEYAQDHVAHVVAD